MDSKCVKPVENRSIKGDESSPNKTCTPRKKIVSIESWLFIRDPYFMVYEIIPIYIYNWVGFHPLYTLHNEIFVHVKRVLRSPQQHFPPENGWLEYLFRFGMAYFQV